MFRLLAVVLHGSDGHADIIADAACELDRRTQGQNGWFYGYYDRTADLGSGGNGVYDNTKFTRFRGGSCRPRAKPVPTTIGILRLGYTPCEIFPETEITNVVDVAQPAKGTEHFSVCGGISNKSGHGQPNGFFHHVTAGLDGTIGRIFQNGVEIYAERTLGDVKEIDLRIPHLGKGDKFDFAVDFGTPWGGNASNDETAYSFIVDHTRRRRAG